jgi:hypothetical protein
MIDRARIHQARHTLTSNEFNVWLTKHVAGKGRRSGSLALGITEDAWRYRLQQAERKLDAQDKEAA